MLQHTTACLLLLTTAIQLHAEEPFPVQRSIKDRQGRILDATILSATAGSIRIRRTSDGKEFDVPTANLSAGDRAWLESLLRKPAPEVVETRTKPSLPPSNPVTPPAPPTLQPVRPPTPAPPPVAATPQWVLSKDILSTQKQMVCPPAGWDAFETSIRFLDGKVIDGFVYDIRDEEFWYAGKDLIQKKAGLSELTPHCRIALMQWKNRLPGTSAPSVELQVDGKAIHASILRIDGAHATLLTEQGEWMDQVPLEKMDAAGLQFYWLWTSGTWVSGKRTDWAIPASEFTAAWPFFENGKALAMRDKKWGLIDRSGSWVEQPRYDNIKRLPGSRNLKVSQGGKWGLMLDGGRMAVPPEWDDVGDIHEGMIPVSSNGKWGYAGADGKPVIKCEWDDAWRFSPAGLAVVTLKGKRGFVDRTGKVVVKPEWDGAIMPCPQGVGAVRKGKGWALINREGKLLTEPIYQLDWSQRRFELGYIPVSIEGKAKLLLGMDGKPVTKPKLPEGICLPKQPGPLLGVDSGRFRFTIPDRAGVLQEFDEIQPVSGGLAAVRKGNKWGYADKDGLALEPRWDTAGPFRQGLSAVVDFAAAGTTRTSSIASWPWQFIDDAGHTVISAVPGRSYDIDTASKPWAPEFKDGHALVRTAGWTAMRVNDRGQQLAKAPESAFLAGSPFPKSANSSKFGLINLDGKTVYPPEWHEIRIDAGRMVAFMMQRKWGIANLTGEIIHAPEWDEIKGGISGLVGIRNGDKWGLADAKGNVILAPTAKQMRFTEGGYAIVGGGNRMKIYWPNGELLSDASSRLLVPIDEYGEDLILYEGDRANPSGCWRANSKTHELQSYDGSLRVYWNKSFIEHERIWLEDKDTKRWHFSTLDGKRLGPEMEEKPSQWFFDEGMGIIRQGETCYFIDKEGKKFGGKDFQDARVFQHGLAAIKMNGKWGFMDRSGAQKIACDYDDVGNFFEAARSNADEKPLLAAVFKDGRWGYVNTAGKLVIPLAGEQRGLWNPYSNHIYFPQADRKYLATSAYDSNGNPVDPQQRAPIKRSPHPLSGSWKMFQGDNGLLGIKTDSGTVVIGPEWRDITWVAPGVVALEGAYDGGLFSIEKGWLFRDDDQRRIARRLHDGRQYLHLSESGMLLIEETPKWGYARFIKPPIDRMEAEKSVPLSHNGGYLRPQNMLGFGKKWSGNMQLHWVSAKPGNYAELAVIVPHNGTYEVTAQFTKAPDYGIFDFTMNQKDALKGLDLYNTRVDASGEITLGAFELTAGLNVLRITVAGKNPAASPHYMCGLDYIKTIKQ